MNGALHRVSEGKCVNSNNQRQRIAAKKGTEQNREREYKNKTKMARESKLETRWDYVGCGRSRDCVRWNTNSFSFFLFFFSFAVKSVPMPLRFQTVSELARHITLQNWNFDRCWKKIEKTPTSRLWKLMLQTKKNQYCLWIMKVWMMKLYFGMSMYLCVISITIPLSSIIIDTNLFKRITLVKPV